jgi:hypothetical protein
MKMSVLIHVDSTEKKAANYNNELIKSFTLRCVYLRDCFCNNENARNNFFPLFIFQLFSLSPFSQHTQLFSLSIYNNCFVMECSCCAHILNTSERESSESEREREEKQFWKLEFHDVLK